MPESKVSSLIAGDAAVLARRYARAIYELASERKQLDSVAAELGQLKAVFQDSKEFHLITQNPRLSRKQLAEAMQKVSDAAKLGPLTQSFLKLLAKNRRLGNLEHVVDVFMADLIERRGEFTAEVITPKALAPAVQEKLAKQMDKVAGGKVHLVVREDASLLGGLMVKLGSRLIDASVKGKLTRLERQLKSQREAA
jgi:F-type H+-transporting ATPase subunit delta